MSKIITAKFKDVPAKKNGTVQINLSEEVHAILSAKNIDVEIVQLDEHTVSVYAVQNNEDSHAVTFNPKLADAYKLALVRLLEKINNQDT